MNTKHKHYEVIVAWAAGQDIQVRPNEKCQWVDLSQGHDIPAFSETFEYRIKPKPEYPTTTLSGDYLSHVNVDEGGLGKRHDGLLRVANVAIRHAIDSGQVIIAPKGE